MWADDERSLTKFCGLFDYGSMTLFFLSGGDFKCRCSTESRAVGVRSVVTRAGTGGRSRPGTAGACPSSAACGAGVRRASSPGTTRIGLAPPDTRKVSSEIEQCALTARLEQWLSVRQLRCLLRVRSPHRTNFYMVYKCCPGSICCLCAFKC